MRKKGSGISTSRAGRIRQVVPSEISDEDFDLFRRLIYDRSGISLNFTKKEMLCTRLGRILRRRGFETFREYYDVAVSDRTGEEIRGLVSAISTNMTYFYREPAHFHHLEHVLIPQWKHDGASGRRRRLRLWSAGCSTGEEAFSLAISLHKCLTDLATWDAKILAVDISQRVIEEAIGGVYARDKINTVPSELRARYFNPVDGSDGLLEVDSALRRLIAFRELNLVLPAYPFSGRFDLVLCRNVMLYFDSRTQERLLENLYRHLYPGGTLFVGHVEVLEGLRHRFRYLAPGIYRKPEDV